MANAATHQGTCQVCGKLHMLPDGVLAKHGYTVEWGFFSGVCKGAGHLPFEQDISLIYGMIAWAVDTAASHRLSAETLELPTHEPVAMCRVYVTNRDAPAAVKYGRSEHAWVHGTIIEKRMSGGHRHAIQITEGRFKGLEFGISDGYQYGATLAQVATYHNRQYAEQHHRRLAKQLTTYADWQRARIAGWAAHPDKLIPVIDQSKPKVAVGMTVRIGGKNGSDETVIAIEDRKCQGCGPFLNGQILPHAVFAGKNGKTWAIPVRSIRLPKVA